MEYQEVLDFWFNELSAKDHFVKSDEVDKKIAERFLDLHAAVADGECEKWRATPEGSLAEIIVLDQFSRNLFRGNKKSFTQDELAVSLAETAIEKGFDKELEPNKKMFMYMPFMHSESKEVHAKAVPLFESLDMEETLKYEHIHKDIIDQFGRYPHRNEVMGRESTPEEIEYLNNKSESFF